MKYHLSIPHLSDDKRELKYITEAPENHIVEIFAISLNQISFT